MLVFAIIIVFHLMGLLIRVSTMCFSQISDDGMVPTDADSYDKYTFSARGSHKVKGSNFFLLH